jgi:serine/threonine protein phosphatase PrpC
MTRIALGQALNRGQAGSPGFDAIATDAINGTFVLCDGANSTPTGGQAALLGAQTLCAALAQNSPGDGAAHAAYAHTHQTMRSQFSHAACTALSTRVTAEGIQFGSCGDSLIEVFKYQRFWGWRHQWQSAPDLLEDKKSPSQLLGSEVFWGPSLHSMPARGSAMVLMMSDGLYQHTSSAQRKALLDSIGSHQPGNADLDFISHHLAEVALANGSQDDISIAMIWVGY